MLIAKEIICGAFDKNNYNNNLGVTMVVFVEKPEPYNLFDNVTSCQNRCQCDWHLCGNTLLTQLP